MNRAALKTIIIAAVVALALDYAHHNVRAIRRAVA